MATSVRDAAVVAVVAVVAEEEMVAVVMQVLKALGQTKPTSLKW